MAMIPIMPRTESTISDSEALNILTRIFSVNEWSADLCEPCHTVVAMTGREITDEWEADTELPDAYEY